MELLDQPAYHGPPPRYAVGTTVYYRGLAYTVERVCGRAPLVGWTYRLDGPGELITVGEEEISTSPQASTPAPVRMLGIDPARNPPAVVSFLQMVSRLTSTPLQRAWISISTDPAVLTVAQQLADEEETVCQIAALSGQPLIVCRAALQDYVYGAATLIDQLKRGTVEISPEGDVVSTNYRPYDHRLYFSTQMVPTQAQPRLNRAARRSKHPRWTPPNR